MVIIIIITLENKKIKKNTFRWFFFWLGFLFYFWVGFFVLGFLRPTLVRDVYGPSLAEILVAIGPLLLVPRIKLLSLGIPNIWPWKTPSANWQKISSRKHTIKHGPSYIGLPKIPLVGLWHGVSEGFRRRIKKGGNRKKRLKSAWSFPFPFLIVVSVHPRVETAVHVRAHRPPPPAPPLFLHYEQVPTYLLFTLFRMNLKRM